MKRHTSALYIQQKYCELETLKVFRLLTNQVFGKLIKNQERSACSQSNPPSMIDSHIESPEGNSMDLREHMVGILFSRSKLTHLQKQVRFDYKIVDEKIKQCPMIFFFRLLFISSIRFGKKLRNLVKNGRLT